MTSASPCSALSPSSGYVGFGADPLVRVTSGFPCELALRDAAVAEAAAGVPVGAALVEAAAGVPVGAALVGGAAGASGGAVSTLVPRVCYLVNFPVGCNVFNISVEELARKINKFIEEKSFLRHRRYDLHVVIGLNQRVLPEIFCKQSVVILLGEQYEDECRSNPSLVRHLTDFDNLFPARGRTPSARYVQTRALIYQILMGVAQAKLKRINEGLKASDKVKVYVEHFFWSSRNGNVNYSGIRNSLLALEKNREIADALAKECFAGKSSGRSKLHSVKRIIYLTIDADTNFEADQLDVIAAQFEDVPKAALVAGHYTFKTSSKEDCFKKAEIDWGNFLVFKHTQVDRKLKELIAREPFLSRDFKYEPLNFSSLRISHITLNIEVLRLKIREISMKAALIEEGKLAIAALQTLLLKYRYLSQNTLSPLEQEEFSSLEKAAECACRGLYSLSVGDASLVGLEKTDVFSPEPFLFEEGLYPPEPVLAALVHSKQSPGSGRGDIDFRKEFFTRNVALWGRDNQSSEGQEVSRAVYKLWQEKSVGFKTPLPKRVVFKSIFDTGTPDRVSQGVDRLRENFGSSCLPSTLNDLCVVLLDKTKLSKISDVIKVFHSNVSQSSLSQVFLGQRLSFLRQLFEDVPAFMGSVERCFTEFYKNKSEMILEEVVKTTLLDLNKACARWVATKIIKAAEGEIAELVIHSEAGAAAVSDNLGKSISIFERFLENSNASFLDLALLFDGLNQALGGTVSPVRLLQILEVVRKFVGASLVPSAEIDEGDVRKPFQIEGQSLLFNMSKLIVFLASKGSESITGSALDEVIPDIKLPLGSILVFLSEGFKKLHPISESLANPVV